MKDDTKQFIKAMKQTRTYVCNEVNGLPFSRDYRTQIDNLLIMYDQATKRLAQAIAEHEAEKSSKLVNKLDKLFTDYDTIPFAVWLTGHDEETIQQMYNDWKGKGNNDLFRPTTDSNPKAFKP